MVTDLGTSDLGYDSETLPEDECEVEEETSAAQKASAETLRDVSRELRKLKEVVEKQHDMLEEQRALINQLLNHKGGTSVPMTASSATTTAVRDTGTADSPRGGAVQMLPSTAASLKELYYEACVELGCGGTEKRCRMHGDACKGPNEKVCVTFSGIAMENGAPAVRHELHRPMIECDFVCLSDVLAFTPHTYGLVCTRARCWTSHIT